MITGIIVSLLALTGFFVYSDYRTSKNRKNEGLDRPSDTLVD